MGLLPQDLLLAVCLLKEDPKWTFQSLSQIIGISNSQCYLSFKRLAHAKLVDSKTRLAIKSNVAEFLIHAVKYLFPAEVSKRGKGIATAAAAPVLKKNLTSLSEQQYIWEHPKGKSTGDLLKPIYKTLPNVALKSSYIYDVFAAVDSIRVGKARERDVAAKVIEKLIYD